MTPDELRALADSATPGPWNVLIWRGDTNGYEETGASPEGRLIALALDFARLSAELGEIVQYVRDGMCGHISGECINRTDAVLAKLSELNNGAEHPLGAERTQ